MELMFAIFLVLAICALAVVTLGGLFFAVCGLIATFTNDPWS